MEPELIHGIQLQVPSTVRTSSQVPFQFYTKSVSIVWALLLTKRENYVEQALLLVGLSLFVMAINVWEPY